MPVSFALRSCMDFPIDHIAYEQARVLGGLEHRFPHDNYSLLELNEVNVLLCARTLGGAHEFDFILSQWSGELDPLHPTRVILDNVIARL